MFGYTIVNDVTARDRQRKHKQWFLGKALDTFCPMGPWITTADEIDPQELAVKCWVNRELRQNGNTRDLIFDIPSLIATISAGLTVLSRRHHRDGHPRRRRHWPRSAAFPETGRCRLDFDHGIGTLTNRFA